MSILSYVAVKEALSFAQKGMYVVGAFNVENMEMTPSVIAAAEATHAPVILQTTPCRLKHAVPKVLPG